MADRPLLELVLDDAMFSVARVPEQDYFNNKERTLTGKRLIRKWLMASKDGGFPLEAIIEGALKKGEDYAEQRGTKLGYRPSNLTDLYGLVLMNISKIQDYNEIFDIATRHKAEEDFDLFFHLLTPFFEGVLNSFYLHLRSNKVSGLPINRTPEILHLSNGLNSQLYIPIIEERKGKYASAEIASLAKYIDAIQDHMPRKIAEIGTDGNLDLKMQYGNAPDYAMCLIGMGRAIEILASKPAEKIAIMQLRSLAERAYQMSGFAKTDYVNEQIIGLQQ